MIGHPPTSIEDKNRETKEQVEEIQNGEGV